LRPRSATWNPAMRRSRSVRASNSDSPSPTRSSFRFRAAESLVAECTARRLRGSTGQIGAGRVRLCRPL